MTPTIYMEEYYAMYQQGVQMPEIIRRICDYNESAKDITIEDFDVRRFGELDAVKERIVYKLVNTAMNQDMLQDHPHIEVLDLSMVFQVIVSNQESGQMTITVRNAHMQAWGIDVEQLKETAETDYQQLKTMVQEVNAEMVVQEEVLSEHVYRYDRDKDALEIVM